MSADKEFFDVQAHRCAEAAARCTLPMQREKFERASAAWAKLAGREAQIALAVAQRIANAKASHAPT